MLAVNGGTPIKDKNWTKWPLWSSRTLEQLEDVLKSGRWAISGQWIDATSKNEEFELAFAKFHNVPHAIATDHASGGLVMALEALGIGPGDEVIVPALTWVATAISVCDVNAVPVLVDIDPRTYCISIEKIVEAITERTKAIIPVHLYGCLTDMDALVALAKKYNIAIIEDASHSHGSMWNEKYVGTIGNIGVFSMQQGKAMTSGEGGAMLTSSKDFYDKLIQLRSNSRVYIAESQLQYNRMQLVEKGTIMGTNYCLSEFQAAILLDQLSNLEATNRKKEKKALYLDSQLKNIPGVGIMHRHKQVTKQTYYRYAVKIDRAYFNGKSVASIGKALEAEIGVQVEQPYPPLHQSPLYRPLTKKRYKWSQENIDALNVERYHLPVSEKAHADEGLILHHAILLGEEKDMNDIIAGFQKVQKHSAEIKE